MVESKIIFTGPVGVGKTTAISAISDEPPIKTDAHASDMTLARKDHTTVAMDYGVIHLDEETKVHLYGTPGQERFDFMWDILGEGAHGIVVLVDHLAADPIERMKFYLGKFDKFLKNVPCVVGINKFDSPAPHNLKLADYEKAVHELYPKMEVVEVDIRKEEDVRMLIMSLLFAKPKSITGILERLDRLPVPKLVQPKAS